MSNLQILKNVYAEWNETKGRSRQRWLDLMAANVTFISLAAGRPGMEFTKECHSIEEVKEYFAGLDREWQMIHYTPEEFIEQDDRIVMRGSCSFKSKINGDKTFETPKVDIIHFENGKIRRFYEFYDTAKVLAAASGS